MRTMVKLMATLLIVLSAAASNANASGDSLYVEPQCKLFSVDDRQFRMIYAAAAQQDVQIQIKDQQQRLLYKSRIEANGFARDFNLSFLPDGNYTFVLESGEFVFEQSVSISKEAELSSLIQRFQESQLVLAAVEEGAYALVGTNLSGANLRYILHDKEGQNLYEGEYLVDEEIKDLFTFQGVKGNVTLQFYLDDSLVDERVLNLK